MDDEKTLGVAKHIFNRIKTDNCSIHELDKLLKGTDANSILLEKINDQNLVTFSCEQNQLLLVDYFINVCKLKIDDRYDFPHFSGGCSLLCWACRSLKYDLVNLLLNVGADINFRDSCGKQPLHYLCSLKVDSRETGHSISRLVRHLVNKGADVNGTTDTGETPLMVACQRFHTFDLCKELLSHKAEINAVDNVGNTPLHYLFSNFAGCRNGKLLNVLLQLGADMTQKNNEGETAPNILIKQWCADYIGSSRFLLDDDFLRIVQNNIPLNKKYHMMEVFGAMSALNTGDVSSLVCFWTESSRFRLDNTDLECCQNKRNSNIIAVILNTEECKNSEQLNFNNRPECLKQAIIKAYRHLGFDYHLTLILCRALLDFYKLHSRTQERMTFFTNMLDYIMTDEKYREIIHTENSSAGDLVISFSKHWIAILQDLGYFETEYTQKLLTILLHFLESNTHNAPLDSKFGHCIIGFIRHFSDRRQKMPKEVIRLLRRFIKRDVTFVYKNSNVGLIYFVCEASRKPRSAILQVLLHYGMSADKIDEYGNTALHKFLLHRSRNFTDDEDDAKVVRLLSNHTHLDITNKWNVTPLRLLVRNNTTIYPVNHITLQCFAARVIKQYKLKFVGVIPKYLEPFINLH